MGNYKMSSNCRQMFFNFWKKMIVICYFFYLMYRNYNSIISIICSYDRLTVVDPNQDIFECVHTASNRNNIYNKLVKNNMPLSSQITNVIFSRNIETIQWFVWNKQNQDMTYIHCCMLYMFFMTLCLYIVILFCSCIL